MARFQAIAIGLIIACGLPANAQVAPWTSLARDEDLLRNCAYLAEINRQVARDRYNGVTRESELQKQRDLAKSKAKFEQAEYTLRLIVVDTVYALELTNWTPGQIADRALTACLAH